MGLELTFNSARPIDAGRPAASDSGVTPSHQWANDLLTWATHIHIQAEADLHNARALNQWQKDSPIVSRMSEVVGGLGNSGSLFLPANAYLERATKGLRESIRAIRAVASLPGQSEGSLYRQLIDLLPALRESVDEWHEQHRLIDTYRQGTGQGAERIGEGVKLAYLSIVAITTGVVAGGAIGVGSGLRAVAQTAAVTAGATGTAAGALTAAEQLHAGKIEPGKIAQAALSEAAKTFVMAMIGGALTTAFTKALGVVVREHAIANGVDKLTATYRATTLGYDSTVGGIIGVLAGGGSGALIAATVAVLHGHSGQQLSAEDFCRMVVDDLVRSGILQLALAAVMRRTNSHYVDHRDKPLQEVFERKHAVADDEWALVRPIAESRTDVLTRPKNLDYLGRSGTPHEEVFLGEARWGRYHTQTGKAGYPPESLVISGHGNQWGILPGNTNVATLAAEVLLEEAKKGNPYSQVLLASCFQADARGPKGRSNGQDFEKILHKILAQEGHPAPLPPVHTQNGPGYYYPGGLAEYGTRPASMGGMIGYDPPVPWWQRPEGRTVVNTANIAGIAGLVAEVAWILENHPDLLRSALQAIGIAPDAGQASPNTGR